MSLHEAITKKAPCHAPSLVPMALLIYLLALLSGCDSDEQSVSVDLGKRLSDEELRHYPGQQPRAGSENVFLFGFDLRSSPEQDARQYIPFLRYLERSTGYRFGLYFTPPGERLYENLGVGNVQFAAIGAVTYIRARSAYHVIPLARGLSSQGKSEYRSVIVVRPDSLVKRVEDLRGKRFAFGSIDSTQGHLIPRIVLRRHGIMLNELSVYAHTGSHRNCANAVVSRRYDACGMQDMMGRRLAERGLLRIIHTSGVYPSSGISAYAGVPPEVIAKVKQALLDLDPKGRDAPLLVDWDKTEMPNGFVAARDEDYQALRRWAFELGLLIDAGPTK